MIRMQHLRKLPVYFALAGAVACGPSIPSKEPTTVFRIDTNECRITESNTPWLDIETRYQWSGQRHPKWTARGRYNSSSGVMENVQHNHEYLVEPHDEARLYDWARADIEQCAETDPGRQKRPVGFVWSGH